MIASISGAVVQKGLESLTVEVSGLGYEVLLPTSQLASYQLGGVATLLTRMVVREDSITLYGFATDVERQLFDSLCSISGVGPRLALAILSKLGAPGLTSALATLDETALKSVSGVGQKTARLILLSLADRVAKMPVGRQNLVSALVNLGVTETDAQSLAQKVAADLDDAAALRAALRLRGGGV